MQTATQLRIKMAVHYDEGVTKAEDMFEKLGLEFVADHLDDDDTVEKKRLYEKVVYSLFDDVKAVFNYRSISDPVNYDTFYKWFPNSNIGLSKYVFLDIDRDFIYNSHGLRLLINRYLLPGEPIQYGMLRIAHLLSRDDDQSWLIWYSLVSCGFIHVSSILANAESAHPLIKPGEACRLIVPPREYNSEFLSTIYDVGKTISLGVGVGFDASTIPKFGSLQHGFIRSGFSSLVRHLDSSGNVSMFERKPKIALYISIHNDTIFEAFELKNPAYDHVDNCFIGVMISDYFMKCVKNNQDWYLFPGDAKLDGNYLSDFSGDEYVEKYQEFVNANLYSTVLPAKKLVESLVTSLCNSGSPYIIFEDNVNRFSNHQHLGKIKTLNLCAEITNYADEHESSSCTLLTVNFAMFQDFQDVQNLIYGQMYELCSENLCDDFEMKDQAKFAFMLGFMATLGLNNLMGKYRKSREIGVNPCGVYDMAIMSGVDPVKLCATVSEAMYMGCIHGSYVYHSRTGVVCKKYYKSPFYYGRPQWDLRNVKPSADWYGTCQIMKIGMANSMLTAQAPTATTSMLVGVTESVTIPMSIFYAKESANGRNDIMVYSTIYRILNYPQEKIVIDCDIHRQIAMYAVSAPYVDQSQSTMFSLELSRQKIFDLIVETFKAKLKTGIYYVLPLQKNPTLTVVRNAKTWKNAKCSSSTDCDGCSL